MTRHKEIENDRLPPLEADMPEWDAAPLDWRMLPIDEIQHRRNYHDCHQS